MVRIRCDWDCNILVHWDPQWFRIYGAQSPLHRRCVAEIGYLWAVYIEFEQRLDGYTDLDPAVPSTDYDSSNAGNLIYIRPVYDQSQIPMWEAKSSAHSDSGIHIDFIFIIVFLNIILFGVAVLVRNKMYSSLDTEIIEATLENDSD